MKSQSDQVKITIKQSAQKGQGIFATVPISKGEIVLEGELEDVSDENGVHLMQIGLNKYGRYNNLLPIVNHSCSPNCGVFIPREGLQWNVALRDIAEGEEITVDYATRGYTIQHMSGECLCGSSSCRKKISGWSGLSMKKRDEYGKYVMPYLRALDIEAMGELTVENLMKEAVQKTGLENWGGDDFQEGLNALLSACLKEGKLSLRGKNWLKEQCIHHLCNRLEIQACLENNPEILEEKIERPLFLVTFPRSGSTFMHELICSMQKVRSPYFYELWQPVPSSDTQPDPRIEQLENRYNALRNSWMPEVCAGKYTEPRAEEIQECFFLKRNSFTSLDYTFEYVIPSYLEWLSQHDFTETYRYFKKQLQIIQWHNKKGTPWVLKCADHILDIPALLKAFPDACIIHLHRHPVKMLPSFCYLQKDIADIWRTEPIAPVALGEIVKERYQLLMNRTMEHTARRGNSGQYIDLLYDDLAGNPIETVKKIFDYFDYDLDAEDILEMRAFLDRIEKPKNPYKLETYGLNEADINEYFSDYINYYQNL